MWLRVFTALADALYPPRCVARGCSARGAWLCPDCLESAALQDWQTCPRCAVPTGDGRRCRACRADPPPFTRATSAGRHAGVLRDAIHALKYKGIVGVAPALGRLAAERCSAQRAGTVVVPVPAHPSHVRRRGVDHAALIAREVSVVLGMRCAIHALRRTRPTLPQVGLTRAQRTANVAGSVAAGVPESVAARDVLLVDDVMTTGATARECAAVLLAAHAASVAVCTVARATLVGESCYGRAAGCGIRREV